MKGQLQGIDALLRMRLDLLRNKILLFNMLSAVSMVVITTGVFVTGIFAMNVPLSWQQSQDGRYFRPVVLGTTFGMIGFAIAVVVLLRRSGIFS